MYAPSSTQWSPDNISRAVHVGIFLAVLAVLQNNDRHHPWAHALHVVFLLLPIAWTVGLVPQTSALVSWALEQYNIIALGGTPAASDTRLAISASTGTLVFGITYNLLEMESEHALLAGVMFAAACGSLLSFDWPSLLATTATYAVGETESASLRFF